MKIASDIEICYMIDLRRLNELKIPSCKRIYFGHETCEKLLPEFDEIGNLLEFTEKQNLQLSFVTPFLTNKGIEKVMRFLEQLQSIKQNFEVIISDWGLLKLITENNIGIPVISRFLTGQHTDFRLKRFEEEEEKDKILSMNGTYYRLIHKKVSREMTEHLSSCTLLKNQTLKFFDNFKIDRFELSNILIPIKLIDNEIIHYSLHIPYVPLSIFRSCPVNLDFGQTKKHCNHLNCKHNRNKWTNSDSGCDIYCMDNALYYYNPEYNSGLQEYRCIDRLVYNMI